MKAAPPPTAKGAAAYHEDRGPVDPADVSNEIRRLSRLQPRTPEAEVQDWTPLFRTPRGTMKLRPRQNAALTEISRAWGLFGMLGVGEGKTLVSLLAANVLNLTVGPIFVEPILIVPSSLRSKTAGDMELYRRHFKFPEPHVCSYEELSRQSDLLIRRGPNLIICDEAHNLANPDAARTKRFISFVKEIRAKGLPLVIILLSGTFTRTKLKDYAHLADLSLTDKSPVPRPKGVVGVFDRVMCEELTPTSNDLDMISGFTSRFCPITSPHREDFRRASREALAIRLNDAEGTIVSTEMSYAGPLTLRGMDFAVPDTLQEILAEVRETGTRPDGEVFDSTAAQAMCETQLLQGYYTRWVWPESGKDEEWMFHRAAYHKQVRLFLKAHAKVYQDSPKLVWDALAGGTLDRSKHGPLYRTWEDWTKVKHRHYPQPPVHYEWIGDHMVDAVRDYLKAVKTPTLVWCSSPTFMARAAKVLKLPAIPNGQAPSKVETCLVSTLSHATGLNLQGWCQNLLTVIPGCGVRMEQLIGRTHRPGQTAPVTVDYFSGEPRLNRNVHRALSRAAHIEETTKTPQRLTRALLVNLPPEEED
jgi:hypothetical protein